MTPHTDVDEFLRRAFQEYRDALVKATFGPAADYSEYLEAAEQLRQWQKSQRPRRVDETWLMNLSEPASDVPRPPRAWGLFLDDAGWHVRALISFAKAMPEPALWNVLTEASSIALSAPPGQERRDALIAVVSAYADRRRFEEALTIAALGEDDADRGRLHSLIVTELVKYERLEEAQQIAASIQDPFWNGNAHFKIAEGLAFVGQEIEALRLVQSYAGYKDTMIALTAVTEGLARSGRLERAWATLELIDDPGWRDLALMPIAIATAQAGDLERSLRIARQLSGSFNRGETEAKIALWLFRVGDQRRARLVAQAVETDTYRVTLLIDLAALASHALKLDLLNEAMQQAAISEEFGVRTPSLADIAGAFAQSGEWDLVWDALDLLDEDNDVCFALPHVLPFLARLPLDETEEFWDGVLARYPSPKREDLILVTPALASILDAVRPGAGMELFAELRVVREWWP